MSDRDEITISQAIRMFRIQRENAQRGIRSLPFDELLQKVQADEQPAKPRGVLTLVTEANASQFQQTPKRRGRARKVTTGGNVVALRPAKSKALPLSPAPADPRVHSEISRVAIVNSLRDQSDSERSGLPRRMSHKEHLAAAWRERGYMPP